LALVKLSDESNIGRLETPFGLLRRNAELEVGTEWAIAKIGDRNLMFTFVEDDRNALKETTEKQLVVLRKQLENDLPDVSTLCGLLLPKAKKSITKKKNTKKPSSALKE
jgi:hypothetical protein